MFCPLVFGLSTLNALSHVLVSKLQLRPIAMILAANQDLFTAAGTGVLAVCVVAALAHVHFWVLLALVMGLFAGPTLSILGGLESKDCYC